MDGNRSFDGRDGLLTEEKGESSSLFMDHLISFQFPLFKSLLRIKIQELKSQPTGGIQHHTDYCDFNSEEKSRRKTRRKDWKPCNFSGHTREWLEYTTGVRTGSRESDADIGFDGVELTETTASLQLQVVHGGSCEGSPRLGFDWCSFWWSWGVTAEQ
ncbi:hypothetical protein M0R45_017233 [Rubus argutus]|uniref:Uncharacterized protein n=1 Tax=Rubus argutus TaxID=59490 RepID=A0AAW1XVJ3_RUBAR